jgi:hypothetical protein
VENHQVSLVPNAFALRQAACDLKVGGSDGLPIAIRELWLTCGKMAGLGLFVASVSTAKGVRETHRSHRPAERWQTSTLRFGQPNDSAETCHLSAGLRLSNRYGLPVAITE